jgi:hypothetical protein
MKRVLGGLGQISAGMAERRNPYGPATAAASESSAYRRATRSSPPVQRSLTRCPQAQAVAQVGRVVVLGLSHVDRGLGGLVERDQPRVEAVTGPPRARRSNPPSGRMGSMSLTWRLLAGPGQLDVTAEAPAHRGQDMRVVAVPTR